MAFRLYKEGQGTKARGFLAFLVAGLGLFAAVRTYEFFEGDGLSEASLLEIPFFNWSVNVGSLVAIGVLAVFVFVGYWLYNMPKLSDFLIDTEAELKNKVTWPTRRETFNNSIVVVVTTVILGIWVLCADFVLKFIKDKIY